MVLGDEVYHKTMTDQLNVGTSFDGFQQSPFHFFSGNVFVVQNAAFTVASFFAQLVISIRLFVELGTPFYQLIDPVYTFLHNYFYNVFIAQTISCHQGVFDVFGKTILVKIHHPCYATLRIFGVGFITLCFGKDGYFFIRAFLCYFQSKGEPCYSRSYNEEISLHCFLIFFCSLDEAFYAGSIQALFSLSRLMSSSTAISLLMFFFTTSFPLYKVIFPGPLPT